MHPFSFATTAQLICETGSSRRLAGLCKERGARSVLVVTDSGITRFGLLDEVLPGFEHEGLHVAVYDQVLADPPENIVLAAVEQAKSVKADLVIGFGGGSSMDVAKLVALLAHPDCTQSLADIYGVGNARGQRLPLIQVPTTAGTGSEVTQIAIVTTGATTKMGVVSPLLLPDLALLDADLTLGLPPAVTAATGIDAMVHAIEAYTSRVLKNPLSDNLAKQALRLIGGKLVHVCRNGKDAAARQDILLGATLAGQAFANAPVGAVHALAYPIGGIFHVPHGLSNSLVLPHVLRFNAPAAAPLYAELAEVLIPGIQGDETSKTEAFINFMEQIAIDTGIERQLREVGIKESDLRRMAQEAMKQTRLLGNNPRDVTEDDAFAIYSAAF